MNKSLPTKILGTFFCMALYFQFWGAPSLHACTTFQFSTGADDFITAKSYDWFPLHGHGMLYVNKRNVQKTSVQPDPTAPQPAQWVSRYGSLTFNQFGREFPMEGINEAGLVVEILQLKDTKHLPKETLKAYVNESQWVQYHLDQFATVSEAIRNMDLIRVDPILVGAHYLLCDAQGDCAVVEFLEQKLMVYSRKSLPVSALTNSTYEQSMDYVKDFKSSGRFLIPQSSGSLDRFLRTALSLEQIAQQAPLNPIFNPIHSAFQILDQVKVKFSKTVVSQWNTVYEQKAGKISFRSQKAPAIKNLHLSTFDYSCKTPVKILNIDHSVSEDVSTRFKDYSDLANRELIEKNQLLISPYLREKAAQYPEEGTECLE